MTLAMEKVLKETDPLKRQKAFSKLLESLTAENAELAAEMLRKAPGGRWAVWQEYSFADAFLGAAGWSSGHRVFQ